MESNPLYQALAESMTAPLRDEDHPSREERRGPIGDHGAELRY